MTPDERHKEGLKRFELARNADREQRKLMVEDLLFLAAEDGQWSEDVVTKRKDRPRYTIDKISGAKDQIIGNQRQTRSGIKVIPRKDGDEKTARIYTGLIRDIETSSNSGDAYDMAFDEQLTSGFGGWRVLTDYEADDCFEQILRIEPIVSTATSLYFDPDAKSYTKEDAAWAFVITSMLLENFRKEFPNASETDFTDERYKEDSMRDWFGDSGIRLAEYWYKVPVTRTIGLMSDGRVIDLEEEAAVLDELQYQGVTVKRERKVQSHKVEMVIMNGAEVLTEPQKWAGKYIPLVPVYGRTATVKNKNYTWGLVRKAKDAQRIYNYATSAAVEATALTPKDPVWLTPTQAAGHERQLTNFPTQNSPYMLYNADPLAPGPPQRGGAPQLQTALLQQVQQASTDIHATTGLEPASLGNVPELKSGKAIQAQQAMGDRGSFVFQDNLEKSKRYTGEILVDLIPRVYDTERIVKIIGPDEVAEEVTINEPATHGNGINDPILDEQTGKQVIVNDLSQGSYGVTITTGPAFATRREETVNQLVTLAGQSPVIQELALDLILENMELNNKEEIKSRVRKHMITQGTVEPTEEEKKDLGLDRPPEPDPLNEAMVKNLQADTEKILIGNEKIIAEIHNKDADTQNKVMEAYKTSMEPLVSYMETIIKKLDAGLAVSEGDAEIIEGGQALVGETQIDAIQGAEVAGSTPGPAGQVIAPPIPEGQPQPLDTGQGDLIQ